MHLKLWMGLVLFLVMACQPEVEQIQYGRDSCVYCKMTISDRRYGAELVTQKGKVYKFDAIECMLDYMQENEANYAYYMAVAYDHPGTLQPTDSLTYLIAENMPSPMGAFLTAFSTQSIAKEFQKDQGGELYSWSALQRKFETQ